MNDEVSYSGNKVSILLMFFVRPERLLDTFKEVKKARPKKLFLVSDGPREQFPDDKILNDKCKEIVDDIDWECEVHRNYSETNKGMHFIGMRAFKWAFEHVDSLIFLEDDVIPSQSFFPFCEELLDRYKNDSRIHMICGMNHHGQYNKPSSDYFFSKGGSIWGFALWKRSFELFETNLAFTLDSYSFQLFINAFPKANRKQIKRLSESLRSRWETSNEVMPFELTNAAACFLNNALLIVPTKNMITCTGISENSGHSVNHPLKLPKSIRRLFYMKRYELQFPLKHPKYIIEDKEYEELVLSYMGKNSLIRFSRRVEGKIRRIIYGFLLKK